MSTPIDPRMIRSRKAMITAARELLVQEGPSAVTHQRVAQQAKVGRATVYRHWPRPELLLLDTMATVELPFFRDPVTPVRAWLRRELRVLADEMALPEVAAVAMMMLQGSVGSPPTEVRDRFIETATDRTREFLALATTEGELRHAVNAQDAQALLIGPLLQLTCMQGDTVSDDLIERVMDSLGTWRSPEDNSASISK